MMAKGFSTFFHINPFNPIGQQLILLILHQIL